MANPSNKTTGKSYLSSLSKDELIKRLMAKEARLLELEEENSKILGDYNSLKKEFNSLNRKYNKLSNEDLTKRVLEFKARNLVPTAIREKLILEGQDVSLNVIKDIYNSELNLDLELYYKQCVEKYLETIRINTTLYKQSSIDEINKLLGYAYENLEIVDAEDIRTKMAIMDSISSYLEKRDKLMKNIDESGTLTEQDEALNETTENFKESSRNIIRLVHENIKVIGG
ncbi:MAG: hypothetical protein ACRC1T_09130 [Clostridium chrysemydis]|uniref:hypothetical protein n=1 Tax=Clostridium chrysemydis TaxID=2665504 RepID=UPI003F3B67DA